MAGSLNSLDLFTNAATWIPNYFLRQKAEAELAYELQAAKTKQRIKDEQMQIKVVERTQEILVQVNFIEKLHK